MFSSGLRDLPLDIRRCLLTGISDTLAITAFNSPIVDIFEILGSFTSKFCSLYSIFKTKVSDDDDDDDDADDDDDDDDDE